MIDRITNILKKFKDRDFLIAVGLILLSILIFFLAFYSYAPLDDSDLITIETKVTNVQTHSNKRKAWITFASENGQYFYCRTDELGIGYASNLANPLREEYADKKLTITYTERRDLLPINAIEFWGYERAVTIECGSERLLTMENYNNANKGFFIAFILVALATFVFGSIYMYLFS